MAETPRRPASHALRRAAAPIRGALGALDLFTIAIICAAILAVLAPPGEALQAALKPGTFIGVGVVFFLHGARLSPRDVAMGLRQPRLHLATVGLTYLAFPLIALALSPLIAWALGPALADGFVFLAALPSTVQSSVAFVTIARGHVAAAIAAASLSNLLGVVLTPIVLTLTLRSDTSSLGADGLGAAIAQVALMVLAPFALGQLLGRWLRGALVTHRAVVGLIDRAVIAVLVYQAVGQSTASGLWEDMHLGALLGVALFSIILLSLVGLSSRLLARLLRLPREDAIVLSYCGSKKSMASGMPMLRVLFGDQPAAGALALPVILFHQIQLVIFAWIANRAARTYLGSTRTPTADP